MLHITNLGGNWDQDCDGMSHHALGWLLAHIQTNKQKITKTKQSETKQNKTAGVNKDMERLEFLCIADGNMKLCSGSRGKYVCSLEIVRGIAM